MHLPFWPCISCLSRTSWEPWKMSMTFSADIWDADDPSSVNTAYEPELSFTMSSRSGTRPLYFWCLTSNSAFSSDICPLKMQNELLRPTSLLHRSPLSSFRLLSAAMPVFLKFSPFFFHLTTADGFLHGSLMGPSVLLGTEWNTSMTKSQGVRPGIPSMRKPASREMISASVELCETEVCFLHVQLLGTNVWLAKIHKSPSDVDFESSTSLAKSESWNSPNLHCFAVSPT